MRLLIALLFFSVLWISPSQAKRFGNQYTEFELPIGWECSLEGSEWVCQSDNKDRKREAIIILAAKVRGPQDTLEQYQSYLSKAKTYTLPGGRTQVSEGKYTKVNEINSHRWVDSLHLASEVPGFYTRYLATVKGNLGIAITFSVGKEHYASYKGIFDKVIATLRAFAQNQDAGQFAVKKKEANILDSDTTFIPDTEDGFDITQKKRGGSGVSGTDSESLMFYALVLALAVFIFMRMRKNKKKKK